MNKSISKALKEYRKEKNWTQEFFADKIGVNRITYINYENGTRTPDCYVLKKINEITGLSVDYILGISETKNVAQSDIAKTTGLSEKAIKFLSLTKANKDFLNDLLNIIFEEEWLPYYYYLNDSCEVAIGKEENKSHIQTNVLDEIQKYWNINDTECPIKDGELPNITPFDYTRIEEIACEEYKNLTENDLLRIKKNKKKVIEICESNGLSGKKLKFLTSIKDYIRFDNGHVALKGASGYEILNRNHSITLFIGGKCVQFPSEESDKIVERLLLENVIDNLKELKKLYKKTKHNFIKKY